MSYKIVEWRQAWRIIRGTYYREAVVLRADGEIHLYLIPDGPIGA